MGNQTSGFPSVGINATPVGVGSPGGVLIDPAGDELVPSTALDNVWKGDGAGGWVQGSAPAGPPSGAASGGLAGTYPGPTVNGLTAGVLTDDAAHGVRGGGTQHADSTVSVDGFESATDKEFNDNSAGGGMVTGGQVTKAAGLTVDVAAGSGWINDGVAPMAVNWGAVAGLVVVASAEVHVFINSSGVVTSSTSNPMATTTIHLATCRTSASAVELLARHTIPVRSQPARRHQYAREVVGPISVSGTIVTENSPPSLKLDVDAGTYYIFDTRRVVGSGAAVTFTYWHRDGSGGFTFVTGQTDIDAAKFDDGSGTLATIPATKYKKDLVFIVSSDSGVEYHVVYGQETFATQNDAELGNNPSAAGTLVEFGLRLAGVVVLESATDIASIVDQRPKLGQAASGATAVTDHGGLAGLGDDDHPQYTLASGTRAFTGDLDMGTFDVTNVGTVDGVDVSAHSNQVGDDNPHKVIDYVTGLLSGGTLSINGGDAAKFDLATGIGLTVDLTDPSDPGFTKVSITARVAVVDAFPGAVITYVLIDSSDTLSQQATAPTQLQRRDKIFVGRFVKDGGVITTVVNNPIVGYGLVKTFEDLLNIIGGVGVGSDVSANSDLTLDISIGTAISLGRGFVVDKKTPNTIDQPAQTPVPVGKFFKLFENAVGDLILDTSANTLDPDRFNNGGTLASVTPLGYTIQRAFIFPETNILVVYYGNTVFATLNSAINHRQIENWEEHADSMPGVFRAWIIVQEGISDLAAAIVADPPRATIVTAGVIRPPVAKGIDFVPSAVIGQFSDSTSQKPSVTTPVVVTFDTDDTNAGIGHSRPEDFKILTSGFYSFVFQPQTERIGSGGIVLFHSWPRVGRRDGAITAVAFGSPTTITAVDHRIQTGQTVTLAGLSTTPDINGAHVVTVIDADTFTITTVTSAVADGIGTWTRQLDVSDDVPRTNIELALTAVSQSDVIPLFLNKRFDEEDVVQMMQSVSDETKGAGLVAKTPAGEPAIPSVILSVNKVGDQ